ncbi:hypothetical protein [Hymenobacter arizonensis]|uniref:Uncharacterized protein n=1 Tax=Hymenobacter arizonensis TaxID=1227077 RepID=A0A1I6B4H7_HYMAR|nr:hypothetical protein [Hymenobacter arizonensis]SFQ75862.1 hypothetical protein SAMN04515668_4158 [Hymenobacter arizonensis]
MPTKERQVGNRSLSKAEVALLRPDQRKNLSFPPIYRPSKILPFPFSAQSKSYQEITKRQARIPRSKVPFSWILNKMFLVSGLLLLAGGLITGISLGGISGLITGLLLAVAGLVILLGTMLLLGFIVSSAMDSLRYPSLSFAALIIGALAALVWLIIGITPGYILLIAGLSITIAGLLLAIGSVIKSKTF